MSKYCAVENQSWVMFRPGERFHRITNRSGLSYGRGRNSNAFATLKMEVFAPIPIASDNTAASVKPGFLAKERRANRMSCIQVFIGRHRSIGSGQLGDRAYRNDGRLNSNSGRQHVLS